MDCGEMVYRESFSYSLAGMVDDYIKRWCLGR